MDNDRTNDDICELAASYALGALEGGEAEAFVAHLAEGCAVCAGRVRAFEGVTDAIGAIAVPVSPPGALRARVLDSVAVQASFVRDGAEVALTVARGDAVEWEEFSPGVRIKTLDVDSTSGRIVALVRMEPGARVAPHRHVQTEEVYVLEGDCHVAPGQILHAGDYYRAEAGSVHERTYTQEGTTFLSMYLNEFSARP